LKEVCDELENNKINPNTSRLKLERKKIASL
jgi:hypothetical protein